MCFRVIFNFNSHHLKISPLMKIIVIMFFMELKCENVDTLPRVTSEFDLTVETNKKTNIINYFIHINSLGSSKILWKCFNLKMWKTRKRHTVHDINANFFDKLVTSKSKRSVADFDVGAVISNKISPDMSVTVSPTGSLLIQNFKKRWPIDLWRSYGMFTDDYIEYINPHWLHFPPPNPLTYYALGGVYIVIALLGCFGNLVVVLMYLRCRTLRTPGNILVANLALSDFLMLAKTPIFIFNSFNLGPALGKSACVLYGFAGGLSGTTSIATLTAIALDRYWAVVYPLEPLRTLTAVRARLLALGAWLYAGFFAIIPVLDIGYGHYVPEGFLTSCSFDYLTEDIPPRYFIFAFFCAGWLIPLCIISFCYTRILCIVVGKRNISTRNQEQKLSSRHVKEQVKRKAEIKLALLVIIVIAVFFISWTPYSIVALLGIFGKKDLITPIASMLPALFCKTAACVNPFIYIITHPKFRKELQKLLFKDKSRRMTDTFRTATFRTETFKAHRKSKDLSETDVEVIEMKDIPCNISNPKLKANIQTVSSRISERKGSQKSQRSISMKSFEENLVSPPSWYSKPEFSKQRSFHRRLTKSSF